MGIKSPPAPTAAPDRSTTPPAVTALCVASVVLTVLFAAVHRPMLPGVMPAWVPAVALNAVYACATAVVIARAVLVRSHRAVWALVAAGMCCYTAGTGYTWIVRATGGELLFPSMADAAWLSFYPLAYCGVMGFFGGLRLPWRLILDGAIAGFGGAALFSLFVVDILVGRGDTQGLEHVVTLAYPVGDALLLGTLLCGMTAGKAGGLRNPVLLAAIATFVVADTCYVVYTADGSWQSDGLVNVLYLAALSLFGMAAWYRRGTGGIVRPAPIRLAVSIGFAAGALILLVVASQRRMSTVTVTLAGITLVLVVARVFAALRELESVGRERHDEARRDPLTGLANRRAVLEYVDGLLTREQRPPIVMLLLDLDRFKEVNDSYGHPAGDQLLRQVAARLQDITRGGDVVGRLGGDEFVLVLTGDQLTTEEADRLAERIRTELRKPFPIDGAQVAIDVSIGIALDQGEEASALFQHADIAMYVAKRAGGGHVVYQRHDDQAARDRLELTSALRRDVGSDAMVLYYQPKVDLHTRTVRGFEGLVRWQHPELGLLTPDRFLPMAEQNGLMPTLTHNVLSQAIRQCARWHATGNPVSVSVNASATDLRFEQFPQHVAELLDLHGLPARALTVEITETMMLTEWSTTERVLDRLTAMGVDVSVDDYGTHHSTLSYLRRLHNAKELKLDRSFIVDLRTEPRSATIVRSTIELAHALGMRVVAEGVEDADTLDVLREWGCDLAQGYHLGRPQPADNAFTGLDVGTPARPG